MEEVSFKERVKNVVISTAKIYKKNFLDYEYLICSDAFKSKDFYIINAKEDNYQHLTGVHALVSPKEFFNKCYNGTLIETDFDFVKRGQSEGAVKGSVRRKISVLPNIVHILESTAKVQENFEKNQVKCSFATADGKCTLGFVDSAKSRPMSLIKGNELDRVASKNITLLLRKEISKEKFDEIIIGDLEMLNKYSDKLELLIDANLKAAIQEFKQFTEEVARNISDSKE